MAKHVYSTFANFYPFYLSEHQHPICRRLQVTGSALVVLLVAFAVLTATWTTLLFVPVAGYGFAWTGHLLFEKNRPATFTYPIFSLMGDWVMFRDVPTGKIKF